jgi:hypothetical protein
VPLVLVSNEVNATDRYTWKDIEGVQYHYPNGYRNLIKTGEPFAYYRGRRRSGGRRSEAEYFGSGVIGEIWRDSAIPDTAPRRNWAWYCSIEDYVPFPTPVPARANGEFLEQIRPNAWRNGVRPLPIETLDRIMEIAGMPGRWHQAVSDEREAPSILPPLLPVELLDLTEAAGLLWAPASTAERTVPGGGGQRRSRDAKTIGDRAEAITLRLIRDTIIGARSVRHVAVSVVRVSETTGEAK